MDLATFVEGLRRLDGEDLRAIAGSIDRCHQSAADELDAWETLLRIEGALRHNGRSRAAARAAHLAVEAVRAAARASEIQLPDAAVTRVAREAALVARGLVAGPEAGGWLRGVLVEEWPAVVRSAPEAAPDEGTAAA